MFRRRQALVVMLLAATVAWAARKPGEPLKPGFNLFSKQQDIEVGQANAKQVSEQYQIVQNQSIQNYVKRIGERLAQAPEAKQSGFPFSFTVVNVGDINAFALPGGPMFVFTGLLKATDNEGQVAGVMGHEMAHVILRHGTNQASKANLVQLPAMLAGGLIGNDSMLGQLANLGLGLGANSYLLKFSRDAETEADALGSHLMANAGYDPVEMARFFQKLGAKGNQPMQFFSDHPNPGNREKAIKEEMQALPRRSYGYQSGGFGRMKSELASLPAPPKKGAAAVSSADRTGQQPPAPPTGGMKEYRNRAFSIRYPASWQVVSEQEAGGVTIAPREGLVNVSGATQIGNGAILSYFTPQNRGDLKSATDELVQQLRSSNPRMEVGGGTRNARAGGAEALVTMLSSNSPYGGAETDALITVLRPQGLFYLVFVAPQGNFAQFQGTLEDMVNSLRFE
jgi:beta-barrel assembly-enhancing protease